MAKFPGTGSEQTVPVPANRSLAGLNVVEETELLDIFEPIATSFFLNEGSPLEFLPRRSSRFGKFYDQLNSRRNLWIGLTSVGALALLAFLCQVFYLNMLQNEWDGMKHQVAAAKKVQKKINEFQPWFDSSVPSLTTARAITKAFPETGDIWLKQLDIKDAAKVLATGSSRDQNTLVAILDKLRKTSGISDLELKSQQGSDPIYFSFEFDWNPPSAPASTQ